MKYRSLVIAVDGPAGSGKSTTASQTAGNLGYLFLDTGAMYRALGLVMIRSNVSPDDPQSSASHAESVRIDLQPEGEGVRILLDGEDVSKEIRTSVVSDAASRVAIHPGVREILVARQQEMGRDGGVVAEGRDTGTVVFPSADLKVFLHASAEARAERRLRESIGRGEEISREELLGQIQARDERDRQTQSRMGPWPAADAVLLDTTNLSIDQQVDRVVELALERGAEPKGRYAKA